MGIDSNDFVMVRTDILVENLFIKIFCVIMIIVTITITFFSDREEDF